MLNPAINCKSGKFFFEKCKLNAKGKINTGRRAGRVRTKILARQQLKNNILVDGFKRNASVKEYSIIHRCKLNVSLISH